MTITEFKMWLTGYRDAIKKYAPSTPEVSRELVLLEEIIAKASTLVESQPTITPQPSPILPWLPIGPTSPAPQGPSDWPPYAPRIWCGATTSESASEYTIPNNYDFKVTLSSGTVPTLSGSPLSISSDTGLRNLVEEFR